MRRSSGSSRSASDRMQVVDVNVLHAVNAGSGQYTAAKSLARRRAAGERAGRLRVGALLAFILLTEAGTAGNLTTDAHLAALAIEHGGRLVSFDRDFARFPGVRLELLA